LEEKCEISKGMIQLQDHPKEYGRVENLTKIWGF